MIKDIPKTWEVWLADVIFDDYSDSKKRPVIVVDAKPGSIKVIELTSREPKYSGEYLLRDWQHVGLQHQSTVKGNEITRLRRTSFVHKIGDLSMGDVKKIMASPCYQANSLQNEPLYRKRAVKKPAAKQPRPTFEYKQPQKKASNYKLGFSLVGLLAFVLQVLPYLPWVFFPPAENPLAENLPANNLLGFLESAGGVLTVALLILVVNKTKPDYKNRFFIISAFLLGFYYIAWAAYFMGYSGGYVLLFGLTAPVPLYYFFISLWRKNYAAAVTSVVFFIGHTVSNWIIFM